MQNDKIGECGMSANIHASDWNYGAIFAGLGVAVPGDRPALIHGDAVTSWADFDKRTTSLAAAFHAAGAVAGDKIAHLMRNGPAYMETTVAGAKARLVHVNVNYRYTGEELFYILDNADAAVLVHDAEFADIIAQLAPRLPRLKLILQVGGEAHTSSQSFEAAATSDGVLAPQDYRGDDMLFIYTGGTTGFPKGVMWDQSTLWELTNAATPVAGYDELFANAAADVGTNISLIMPPLMHGSGFLIAFGTLAKGGTVLTMPGHSFDPAEVFAAVRAHSPNFAVIVGDAFARPLLRALDAAEAAGAPESIASIGTIISSGTMWSPEIKAGLLRHHAGLMIIDALASSESLGMGAAIQTVANAGEETKFVHDANTLVLDEGMRPVVPGSGVMGRIARGGLIPRGYYKDDAKTAATFVNVDGARYSLAGDWAMIEADGSITLLGRGSQCINTGGEKVFPEEVEEALKTHPGVDDALVFGVADEKWGQRVTAVVEGGINDLDALGTHVRALLAAYKTPKHIVRVIKVPRAPNGKADYAAARIMAEGLI
jgi:3-oxocholest-4-en-26-oate---CoA ligase